MSTSLGYIITFSDAMDVVGHLGIFTTLECTVLVFHEFLEAVFAKHLVLLMVALVLLCKNGMTDHKNGIWSIQVTGNYLTIRRIIFFLNLT